MNQPLNSIWQITGASLLGGPFTGFYLMHKNFKVLGQSSSAKFSLNLGFIFGLLLVLVTIFAPENFNGIVFAGIYCGLIRIYAEKTQGENYSKHIENGGSKASQWQWFLTGIVSMLIFFVVAFLVAFLLMTFAPEILPDHWYE
ncbi:hypothetical protein [Shewanella saliphila]|uniref:DUF4345 domain-containing protein n=1 Tax=Shewanella saliphila TaxID=2282698 RepID=A0ABQ2Q480_9GAMM|nr:hypothetical protein [Shewanella saliphila]MCL1101510.1 hypothetical protein [Shewanella saliphila]GGP47119.1 hypothetical protein GCM10009409_12190 [Shewanella saliphila]